MSESKKFDVTDPAPKERKPEPVEGKKQKEEKPTEGEIISIDGRKLRVPDHLCSCQSGGLSAHTPYRRPRLDLCPRGSCLYSCPGRSDLAGSSDRSSKPVVPSRAGRRCCAHRRQLPTGKASDSTTINLGDHPPTPFAPGEGMNRKGGSWTKRPPHTCHQLRC